MTFRTLKWAKFFAYISGGGLTALFVLGGPHWTAIGAAVIAVAGALGALFPSPAQAVVADAKTVTPGGTPTGATVLSTTSQLLPGNQPAPPQGGNP